ncbi:TPA: hypothetical protein EYP66_12455 [Candidatus Poribacteria bacterium]|nr:hypothetical protein [Candidatus Poribacteria bacterium]
MKKTRLLSVSFPAAGYGSVETNRKKMVDCLEKAGAYRPDFVCFTEVALELGTPKDSESWQGEPIPGPTTEALGSVARKYHTHVSQSKESVIVDMCGRRLAWQGYQEPLVAQGALLPFAFADVNTDCKAYHLDFNQEKLGDIEAKYGPGVRFLILRPEATFVMESLMEEVSVEDIELEALWTYYDRARKMKVRFSHLFTSI